MTGDRRKALDMALRSRNINLGDVVRCFGIEEVELSVADAGWTPPDLHVMLIVQHSDHVFLISHVIEFHIPISVNSSVTSCKNTRLGLAKSSKKSLS